ncbi:SDR family oxidoreductase [Streptomyces sp. AF1A]|uniref:SDR family oxidoreductase n=1 Tax=Streptomyces sp. AF1A TaxID=3394350 RepID=UPI0039BD5BCE
MDLGISGRVALVAASTAGLGRATARALAAEGARVVISGRRAEVVEREAAALPGAVGIPADLTDPGTPEALVRRTGELLGPVDILVLNGGGPAPGTAADQTPESLSAAVGSLLLPHQALIRHTLPGMRERGWGRILAIGSSGVNEPLPGLALSNAGRAALAGLLKTLASEVAADGVTVNMLLPGRIATDRVAALDRARAEREHTTVEAVAAAARAAIPAGRYGTPEEFGAAAAFLCSAPASYVTGSQVRVDGGMARSF